ncbi:DUF6580 family putative transport protein [Chitinophaga sp. CF418]|uniref:DUF6580 family putative transport protein n=1 Tax=Chitinophaga sp. CF418 TaxID=1855287 RepID=UPI0009183802|nr:DUF6580 family putative transport protein [Chitinophaga sp. CF418]SHN18347.1 hypothetical protein SAMN05216311_106209 [Chitinophaga sp. CF418]
MKKDSIREILIVAMLIFLSALCRIFTNQIGLWNFNAIGAAALFGGIVLKDKRLAYVVPLLSLFLSDVFLQCFTSIHALDRNYLGQLLFVYGAFLLITWIGTLIKKVNVLTLLLSSIGTGVLFFLISNLGTFITTDLYPKTGAGLLACYAAGIPFYQSDNMFSSFALNGLMGNVFFTAVLFGAWAAIKQVAITPKSQLA